MEKCGSVDLSFLKYNKESMILQILSVDIHVCQGTTRQANHPLEKNKFAFENVVSRLATEQCD